jgi:hypothetical protein
MIAPASPHFTTVPLTAVFNVDRDSLAQVQLTARIRFQDSGMILVNGSHSIIPRC